MFSKEQRPFTAAGGAQIEPFAGEWTEIVVAAFRVGAADSGDTMQIVTT